MRYVSFVLAALLTAAVFTGCSDSDDAKTSKGTGTCASTCARSVALACPNESFKDQATCEAQCNEQTALCDDKSVVSAYLDCIQAAEMYCGTNTGTASSSECLQEGLMFFACTQGGIPEPGDQDGGDTTIED